MQRYRIYYLATAVFLLLDFGFGVNVRVAFLEQWPVWRLGYYLVCFGCLALIVWRPALATLVTTVESLVTLSALILHMGVRVMTLSTGVFELGESALIHFEEIVNFVIAGFAAWWGWHRGARELGRRVGT